MRLRSLCLLVLLLLWALPAVALEPSRHDADAPVDLEADQLNFDEARGLYHAEGKARLSQGALRLTSDQIWWNKQTGEVEAVGDARVSGPTEVLSGKRITYNLQQGTGAVEEGEAFWQTNSLRISGQRLERLGPNHFRVYDGRFTLCESARPAWSLGSSVADVRVGRYLTAKHARVYIKDIPAFYLPYVVLPIKTERESGFLLSSLSISDKRGTEFSTAWYQVLGRNMDATFYLDHMSRLGTGVGLEYRYISGSNQRGEFNSYAVFARDGNNPWAFDWQHFGQLGDHSRLVVDAEYVNETGYFSDYGEIATEYNKQKVISSLFVNRRWSKASLTAQYKSIEDLETEDSSPWQSAPLLDYAIAPWRIGKTPFYLGLESSYIDFMRDQGPEGQRLMLRPTLGVHSFLFKGVEFDSEYSYRQRQYFGVDPELADSSGSSVIRARLSSSLFRVYGNGQRRWLHGIEPEINYNRSEENLAAVLPDFDRYDRSAASNSLGYALVTRLSGKWFGTEGAETQREVVWLKLSQDYDLNAAADVDPFTDLRTRLITRPTAHSSLGLDLYYDMDLNRVPDFTLDGSLADGKGNSLALAYHKNLPVTGVGKVDNLNFNFDIALLKPLYLHYEQRYDMLESKRLEQVLGLDIRQQCWGLNTTWRQREEERSIMFTLTLRGLGEVGHYGREYGQE